MATLKEVMRYSLELETKDFSKGLDQAEQDAKGTFDDIEDSAEDTGGKFKGLGGKMGTALVAGFAAIGAGALIMKGINQAMDAQAGVRRLQGQFAFTAEEAGRYGDLAGDLYKDGWGAGVEEVQQVVGLAAKKLGTTTTDELKTISAEVLAVSQTWGQDFDAVIRSTDQLIQNDLAPNAEAALDLIVTAFQGGGDEAGDLLDTIDEYSTHWGQMGLDGEEAMNQIIAGFQNGARDADKTGDAIKEMFIRVTDESDATAEALGDLGLDAFRMRDAFLEGGDVAKDAMLEILGALQDTKGEVGNTENSVAILGTQFEDMGVDAVEILGTVEGALGDVDGAAADLTETVAATEWDKFKRHAERGAGDAAEAFASVANSAMRRLAIDHAENQGNDFVAEWLSGGEQAWIDGQGFIRAFDDTLLDNVETFEEARRVALEYAEDGLGETDEAMHAANEIALEWNETNKATTEVVEEATEATANAKDENARAYTELKKLDGKYDDLGGTIDDTTDSIEDSEDAVDDLKDSFGELRREISEKRELQDLQDAYDDVQTAAEEAFTAAAEGAEDADEKLADLEEATDDLRLAVLHYGDELGLLPDERTTEILAMIDEGNLQAVEEELAKLERTRETLLWINAQVKANAGSAYLPFTRTAGPGGLTATGPARAAGGPVTGGSPYVVGEKGPEMFVPGRSGSIVPNDRLGVGSGVTVHIHGNVYGEQAIHDAIDDAARKAVRTVRAGRR